jgi:hypothetical protein
MRVNSAHETWFGINGLGFEHKSDAVEKPGLIAVWRRDSLISGASPAESRDDGALGRTGAFVLRVSARKPCSARSFVARDRRGY